MANLAQDPLVLKVAELLETRQKLDKEHTQLTWETGRHRAEREETRQAFQAELIAAQETEAAARHQEDEATALAEALALERESSSSGPTPNRLRHELAVERDLSDKMLAEESLVADKLRCELEQCDELLRRAAEASRAEAVRRAPVDVFQNCDVLAQLRANVERLTVVATELRRTKAVGEREASSLRARNDEAQRAAAEADAIRREHEADVLQKVQQSREESQRLSTQLANAKEHSQELRSQIRSQLQSAYDGRMARREVREQGVQTRYAAEDGQLKEKVHMLAEELAELKRNRAERTPWWSLCLRASPVASIGNAAAAGAGVALMRAMGGGAPSTPRALTPRSHQAASQMSQTPRSRSAGRRPSTGSASGAASAANMRR